jgi:TrmH family RNA methyltransferase
VPSIASIHNPLVKKIRKAAQKGALTDDGFCVAEGFHLLKEAVRSGCEIEAVLASEGNEQSAEQMTRGRAAVIGVAGKLFAQLSSTETPQGVVALVRPPAWTSDDIFRPDNYLVLALDGVQEPGNAGALLRSAEAFGASGAIFLRGSVNPHNPKCIRASAGSIFRVPVLSKAADDMLLSRHGGLLYALMPGEGIEPAEADLASPCILAVGAEGHGLRDELRRVAISVRIRTSAVESLNAAVAGAILLYEASRQRSGCQ